MLTHKQKELLNYINEYQGSSGASPSFEEMKEALGLKSKSGIHRLISSLEERGFLRRLAHKARALEVVKMPESGKDRNMPANIAQPDFGALPENATVSLPLYGKIAAGTPIEALHDESQFVEIPATLLGRGEHYALTIEGDSMINAGIFDGDTVIIEKLDTAPEGSIVVALIDGHEATLKRFYKRQGKIILRAENPDYEDRTLEAGRIKIQGRLKTLLRQYH